MINFVQWILERAHIPHMLMIRLKSFFKLISEKLIVKLQVIEDQYKKLK